MSVERSQPQRQDMKIVILLKEEVVRCVVERKEISPRLEERDKYLLLSISLGVTGGGDWEGKGGKNIFIEGLSV